MITASYYVVSIGEAVWGWGDSPAAACAMADRELGAANGREPLNPDILPRYTSHALTGDRVGRKNVTDQGEAHVGQLVLVHGRENLDRLGVEVPE